VDEIRSYFERSPDDPTTPWQIMAEAYAKPFLATEPAEIETSFERTLGGIVAHWPTYRVRMEIEFGAWLRRRRRAQDARDHLRNARDAADALGMRPWSERARSELRALGSDSPPRASIAWEALSAQELEVAQLAARGLSNREIGERLFLSHRTVGSHLYRIFPKLGVTNRAQLASALHVS
jgi:DNA-binding CsgD family transcriptional regulator